MPVDGPSAPLRLLLEGPERPELAPRLHDLQHRVGAEGSDELVLEVLDARVEPELLQLEESSVGSEPRPLEPATDAGLLPSRGPARVGDGMQPAILFAEDFGPDVEHAFAVPGGSGRPAVVRDGGRAGA